MIASILPTPTVRAVASTAEVEGARHFRESLGFRSDEAFVAAAAVDSRFSAAEYGIPLAPDEVKEVDRRRALQDGTGKLVEYLEGQVDDFGGMYLDQEHGASINIGLTANVSAHAPVVAGLAPAGSSVNIRVVEYTMHALREVQAAVDAATPELRASGVDVVSTGLDPRIDRLVIGVHGLTSIDRESLSHRFTGAVVAVEQERAVAGSCVSRYNCAVPMKGGLNISANGIACTSGFMGRNTGSFSFLYVITAGHCIQEAGGTSYTWAHNGVALGTGVLEQFYDGSSADVGVIHDSEFRAKNLVYVSNTTNFTSITGSKSNSDQYAGVLICRSGVTSGWDCGTINGTNLTVSVSYSRGAYTLYNQWRTNFPSGHGDSGGPLLFGQTAFGVFGAFTSTTSYYSTIDYISYTAGARPCYSSTCG